jgi:hypothetical protein
MWADVVRAYRKGAATRNKRTDTAMGEPGEIKDQSFLLRQLCHRSGQSVQGVARQHAVLTACPRLRHLDQ